MPTRIAAPGKTSAAITTSSYWRTKIMRRKNVHQVLLLSMFVVLAVWAGAQSTQDAATSSAKTASSPVVSTEQQEIRDELKALRAEVERLRSEVEQQKNTARADDRSGTALAPLGPGPNVPSMTASNFGPPPVVTVAGQPAAVAIQGDSAATKPAKEEPFAFADWTWLNGNPRTKELPFD